MREPCRKSACAGPGALMIVQLAIVTPRPAAGAAAPSARAASASTAAGACSSGGAALLAGAASRSSALARWIARRRASGDATSLASVTRRSAGSQSSGPAAVPWIDGGVSATRLSVGSSSWKAR